MRGELSASVLDGLRHVGAGAYALAEEADAIRQAPAADPWAFGLDVQLFLVCASNAFVLQTIADHLLDSDDRDDPMTAGRLPEATFAFVHECYQQAALWARHGQCVRADASYRVDGSLPAALPPWLLSAETRPVQLSGLRDAYDAVAPRAEYELSRLTRHASARAAELAAMNLLATAMQTSLETAAALAAHARGREQRREVRDNLLQALRAGYELGQLTAMPSLTRRASSTPPSATDPSPLANVTRGWLVVDVHGSRIGTVAAVEGEPNLGLITALLVDVSPFSPNTRVRPDQIDPTGPTGVVRLNVTAAELDSP